MLNNIDLVQQKSKLATEVFETSFRIRNCKLILIICQQELKNYRVQKTAIIQKKYTWK
mgnify:CR=1 FL=1|jgi:hypothetical protein